MFKIEANCPSCGTNNRVYIEGSVASTEPVNCSSCGMALGSVENLYGHLRMVRRKLHRNIVYREADTPPVI